MVEQAIEIRYFITTSNGYFTGRMWYFIMIGQG